MTQIFVKYILHLCIFRHLKLEIALGLSKILCACVHNHSGVVYPHHFEVAHDLLLGYMLLYLAT